MIKAFQKYFPLESRQKVYLTLTFVSLILLFYSVWQIKPVIVEPEDPLGLASHFTPCYWIGLAILVGTSILAFLDRELKKDAIFIVILIAVGLFLFLTPSLVYENARNPDIYRNTQVYELLASHHIDFEKPLNSYYLWPALHLISASLLTVSGVGIGFMRYMPVFCMLLLIFVSHATGKRLGLAPNRCFLLSFLVLSSWLFMSDYTSYTLGMLLYLVLFMLLIAPRRTVAESVAVIFVFAALVITHGLTSLAVIPGLLLLSIYRKEPRFIALFAVVFGAWFMYQAATAMELGIKQWLAQPLFNIFEISQVERYQVPAAVGRAITRYSQLGYLALYGALVTGGAILLLKRRLTGQVRKQVICLFCWSIGVALLIFSGYGQASYRTYLFILIAAVCITVLSFSSRKLTQALIIAVMCLCITFCLPANYGGDAAFGQVLTSELKGAQFMALKVKPEHPFYCGYNPCLFYYYDTNLMVVSVSSPEYLARWPGEVDLSVLDKLPYVIISKQGTAYLLFSWGEDPYATWPQTEAGRKANLIYNNGYYQIYQDRLAE